jgi:hypothetical protein
MPRGSDQEFGKRDSGGGFGADYGADFGADAGKDLGADVGKDLEQGKMWIYSTSKNAILGVLPS